MMKMIFFKTIMINFKHNQLRVFLMTLGTILLLPVLSSCSDDEIPPSAVDEKIWDLDGNKDKSYSPGDNFFMYCNGGWWNSTDLGDKMRVGLMFDPIIELRKENITEPRVKRFREQVKTFESGYTSAEQFIESRLEEYEGLSMLDATVKFIEQGYDEFLTLLPYSRKGKICLYVNPGEVLIQSFNSESYELTTDYLLSHPEVNERLIPVSQARSRAGEDLLTQLVSKLGFSTDDVYVDSEFHSAINDILSSAWIEYYGEVIEDLIKCDYRYVSQEAIDSYNKEAETDDTIEKLAKKAEDKYMKYLLSYAYATQYISQSLKDEYTQICVELKEAFRNRISNLDWMSSTTKERALRKLDMMQLNVGFPDRWMEEGLPALGGNSLAENVAQLRKSKYDLNKAMVGKDIKEMSFNILITNNTSLATMNAFYSQNTNSINIMPDFLLPPMYDRSKSDAVNYAIFYVIGHEMTHGFDSSGANYNEIGDMENWWTVADKMEFEARQKLLIDCHDHLEVLPDEMPGVFSPGEQTLTENIADLGGTLIAYDAYNARLTAEGYYGEELEKQQRRFFEGYAEIHRVKYSAKFYNYALIEKKDTHSMDKERVNGVVMNIDRWYELYDVKRENTLYLPKEKRCYLW